MKKCYNVKRVEVTGRPVFRRPEYSVDGACRVARWPAEGPEVDGYGFDKRHTELVTADGRKAYVSKCILAKGTRFSRYGTEYGVTSAPVDVTYEQRAMPYDVDSIEYHEYTVTSETGIEVTKGVAYPAFDQCGGGVQYLHGQSMAELLREGRIVETSLC